MTSLAPLETLYDRRRGDEIALPADLTNVYGRISFPNVSDRPFVVANFVTSLDGVVSLGIPGHAGGGPISGFNVHDRMVMGLLRALADAVVVGAGTLRSIPSHVWTAQFACPAFADSYAALRASLGKRTRPLNVIVTARGEINPGAPVFQTDEVAAVVVTNRQGRDRLRALGLPVTVDILSLSDSGSLNPRSILQAISERRPLNFVLVEGGPRLLADFFADSCIDEQFLTLSPQLVGRSDGRSRPGLLAGRTLTPEQPLWGTLLGVKQGGDHLFLRDAFSGQRSG